MRGYGLFAAAATAAAVLLGTSPAAAASWTVVTSPPSGGGFFTAVSARADGDAWAVGGPTGGTALIDRWNGTSWSRSAAPLFPGATVLLNAASASSASDAWAVGRITQSRVTSCLALHWTGTAWAATTTPHIAGTVLASVASINPADAYAVGGTEALRWNGAAWSPFGVPAPGGAAPAVLNAVAADSASDVWIAGLYFDTATSVDEPFTAHWNGTAWTSVPVPANGAQFFGLTVISPTDAWAVGSDPNANGVTENWNGSSWRVIPNPAVGLLLSVTATGAANVTAVGHNTTANGPTAAIILNWNGSAWANVTVPVVGDTEELYSTSAAPGGKLTWAFGRSTTSGVVSNLTLLNS